MTKSYNPDSMSQRIQTKDKLLAGEQRTPGGNIIALACGPLKRKRYINPKIEVELVDFKKEIEEKFAKSPLRGFVMPKKAPESHDTSPAEANATGLFNQSRIQKGRMLAQSTDASAMHNYLQNVTIASGPGLVNQGHGTNRNNRGAAASKNK